MGSAVAAEDMIAKRVAKKPIAKEMHGVEKRAFSHLRSEDSRCLLLPLKRKLLLQLKLLSLYGELMPKRRGFRGLLRFISRRSIEQV